MRRYVIFSLLLGSAFAFDNCGANLTANEYEIINSRDYQINLGLDPDHDDWYRTIKMDTGCPDIEGDTCRTYVRYQSDGNTMNASNNCPTQLLGSFWMRPYLNKEGEGDGTLQCGMARYCWNTSLRNEYFNRAKNELGGRILTEASASGVFRYNPLKAPNETIELNFEPCSLLSEKGACSWPYMPRSNQNDDCEMPQPGRFVFSTYQCNQIGQTYNTNNNVFIGTLSTANTNAPTADNFPFEIASVWAKKSSSNGSDVWVPIDSEAKFDKVPPLYLRSLNLPKGRAYISMGYQGDHKTEARLTLNFKPDYCKEETLYLIKTSAKYLYINGKTLPYDGDRARSKVLYINERYEANCEAPSYDNGYQPRLKAPARLSYVADWYKYNCPEGTDCASTGGAKCLAHWDRYLIAYHEFKPRLAIDNKELKYYIAVKGNDKADSCIQKDYDENPIYVDFNTLSHRNSGINVAEGDVNNLRNSYSRNLLIEHPGVLTRLNNQNVALSFSVPRNFGKEDDTEAFYLMIDDGRGEFNLYNKAGTSFVGLNTVNNSEDSCKAADGKTTCRAAYANNSPTARFYYIKGFIDDYGVTGDLKRNMIVFFKNVKTTDFKTHNFKMKIIYVNDKKIEKNSIGQYVSVKTSHAREVIHNPLTIRIAEFNSTTLPGLQKPYEGEHIVVSNINKGVASLIPPSAEVDGAHHPGEYFIDHAQYVVNINGKAFRFYDKPWVNAWLGTKANLDQTLNFPAMPRDVIYALKDGTIVRYLKSLKKDPDNFCRNDDEFDPIKANQADYQGKISCGVPGYIKLSFFGAGDVLPSNVHYKRLNALNLDHNGKSNVLLGASKLFRARVDVYNQIALNSNPSSIVAYEADKDWPIDVTFTPDVADVASVNKELKRFICNDEACSCMQNASCKLEQAANNYVVSKTEQNDEFIDYLSDLCSKTRCSESTTNYADANNSSKKLLKDYINGPDETQTQLAIAQNNPLSVLKDQSVSIKPAAEDDKAHHKVYRFNYFLPPNSKGFAAHINGVADTVHVIFPSTAIKDQKPDCHNQNTCINTIANTSNDIGISYISEKGELSLATIANGCSSYEASGDKACYNKAQHEAQFGGSLGFETDPKFRLSFLSTYNNPSSYDEVAKMYRFTNANGPKSYTKDVMHCKGGIFANCKDFSIEYVK